MSSFGPQRILVGVDNSDTARRALAHAVGRARRDGAELIVLHARQRPIPPLPSSADVQDWLDEEERFIVELRRGLVEAEQLLDGGVRLTLVEGTPFRAIVDRAEAERVDQVVIGASMQLTHRLIGSIAARLVRAAHWPVTVVP